MPDGEDPDSYLKKVGADAFQKYVDETAKDFILFKTELLMKETANDPIQKSIAVKSIIGSISKIPDTLKRSLYIKQYSSILDLDETILHNESNSLIKGEHKKNRYKNYNQEPNYEDTKARVNSTPNQKQQLGQGNYNADDFQEKDLLRVLINYAEMEMFPEENYKVYTYIFENISDILENFDNELYKRIIEVSMKEKENGKLLDQAYYSNHLDAEI